MKLSTTAGSTPVQKLSGPSAAGISALATALAESTGPWSAPAAADPSNEEQARRQTRVQEEFEEPGLGEIVPPCENVQYISASDITHESDSSDQEGPAAAASSSDQDPTYRLLSNKESGCTHIAQAVLAGTPGTLETAVGNSRIFLRPLCGTRLDLHDSCYELSDIVPVGFDLCRRLGCRNAIVAQVLVTFRR